MATFPINYELPPELIAQDPVEPRDQARLLVAQRRTQRIGHHRFLDLPELLAPGDLLVLNDTRVLHARLLGHRRGSGGKWEGLFLGALPGGDWEMIGKAGGRLRPGVVIDIEPGPLALELIENLPEGRWRVRPSLPGPVPEVLERHGHIPLPPYIRKGVDRPEDRERYQTVFATRAGAVAAPTAGLHFTPRVFDALRARGIEWTQLTLHVGLGTFRPIVSDDYRQHPIHAEWGELPAAAAEAIERCKQRGGRIVAVGTTTVRVLETVAASGPVRPWSGETSLYIHPPYEFRVVDALLTNFHLPRTTLLLLVAALAGVELTQRAYDAAVAERYRFYSYGDAMLIV